MVVALVGLLPATLLALASPAAANSPPRDDRATLLGYARDTWRSMVALTDPATGLPADNMTGPVTAPVRSAYTSPTNIGGYLWSTVVARDARIIGEREAYQRLSRTLTTLGRLERHPASGMFYNWYELRAERAAAASGRRPGGVQFGSLTTVTKKSSICWITSMNRSKSTGFVTYALACSS
jgi:hypothetical protein